MSSDLGKTFGFELLYNISKEQICKKEDILILFVHWCLIKNGYKCLGVGDSKIVDPSEKGSELLPNGWNQASNYTFRYIKEGKLYILMGVKSETDFLLNLLRIENHSVSNVQFPIKIIKNLEGSLDVLIPNYETILTILNKDLIEPIYTKSRLEVSTQTSQSQSDNRRDRDEYPLRVEPVPQRPASSVEPGLSRVDPLRIGQDDLNPFGHGRRGMIFDPFSNPGPRPHYPGLGVPGRLPIESVPPGARFDPFGPPDNNFPHPRMRDPDGDYLPPPGYDDMFM